MHTKARESHEDEKDRVLVAGRPDHNRCDNQVCTSKYTILTFIPVATLEQFRRFANLYFLGIGTIMFIGYYTTLYESAISPWTTLGPLALVISCSLMVEGSADAKRHRNDEETNNAPCIILARGEDVDREKDAHREETVLGAKDVLVNLKKSYQLGKIKGQSEAPIATSASDKLARIAFQRVRRMDIRQGHLVLVRNREMVPADIVLMASSSDGGSAYIETSSIDGETNLKMRVSPHLPKHVLRDLRANLYKPSMEQIQEDQEEEEMGPQIESLEQATKRVSRFSALAFPNGISALKSPQYKGDHIDEEKIKKMPSVKNLWNQVKTQQSAEKNTPGNTGNSTQYIAALTSEPPNPHVNTFTGKLTLPPLSPDDECHDIPLGAENILLRGAVLRNTEWVIGFAVFTGTDTKLVQNSFETPSKFSQLDRLMNWTVLAILIIMCLCVMYLASNAYIENNQRFDELWYIGYGKDQNATWPNLEHLPAPEWDGTTRNFFQYFFLYITLLSNFVPLSLYVTVEVTTICMLWFIYVDLNMYDDTTDTRAVARSTIVTDLGRVQYIFSDKTGTLTQNVMRFKRCSVDGMVFGAPILKSRPRNESDANSPSAFHPLRHLLVGKIQVPSTEGNRVSDPSNLDHAVRAEKRLTFNAEMFLRVMSLCHTVVVEKDLDQNDNIETAHSVSSQGSSLSSRAAQTLKYFGRKRTSSESSTVQTTSMFPSPLPVVSERDQLEPSVRGRDRTKSTEMEKGGDGAPFGFAYQAESPDEGALVSAASRTFDFQVISRDSAGIRLRRSSPSIFEDDRVVQDLKNGAITLQTLAAETAAGRTQYKKGCNEPCLETWTILAVNKFDSDRKRMSILVRAPPELGELTILFCKGADSAMLDDPSVCTDIHDQLHENYDERARQKQLSSRSLNADEQEEWELAQYNKLRVHLSDFASEGLRTLVLGMKVVTPQECSSWLQQYNAAATSLKNRDHLLKEAAIAIERNLYVVGATAIEDKLQKGVPETIATLEKAGIKLWVLTGDKRETAVEIGYSTHVLTPSMHLTQVPDQGVDLVRAQIANEFMRLVKMGKLSEYQKAAIEQGDRMLSTEKLQFCVGKCARSFSRSLRRFGNQLLRATNIHRKRAEFALQEIEQELNFEKSRLTNSERRRNVRKRAEKIIRQYLSSTKTHENGNTDGAKAGTKESSELEIASGELPRVFDRAQSARETLADMDADGKLSQMELRSLSLAQLTAQQANNDRPLVEEDTLSIASFFPDDKTDSKNDFNRKKRTILERLFAVDREVRRGKLLKHLKKEKLAAIRERSRRSNDLADNTAASDGPRALVIEGAALKHILGDPELEELIFAVASQCEAVIACRVSPKQKALLVNLVRYNIVPEPVTLAIGDGANDVGMIQEAHVGVGISGKEGKQAVNASDFAIAQFRFLEDLVLIHGRWDFFRLSIVVLFSFYKNAFMIGNLIIFSGQTAFSGTPLFDEWLIAMLNFVAGWPILLLGIFDRCLSKEYVKSHPEVYKATRTNELLTKRTLLRWIAITAIHASTVYYFTVPAQSIGGGISSAFDGLMDHKDTIGDGEGGDLDSVGTVSFTCLIIILAYKVIFESRSLVHGRWPALAGCHGKGEGFFSRVAYTWIGIAFLSIAFYLWAITIYSLIGRQSKPSDFTALGPSSFSQYVDTAFHVLGTRSISWLLIIFVPVFGAVFDVTGKVFSNMFYPTQTQIHLEIEAMQKYFRNRDMPVP